MNRVGLASRCTGQSSTARPAPIEFALDLGFIQKNAGRASVHNAAYPRAV